MDCLSLSLRATSPVSTSQYARKKGYTLVSSNNGKFQVFFHSEKIFEVKEDAFSTAQTVFENTLAEKWGTFVSSPSVRNQRFTIENMVAAADKLKMQGDDVEKTKRAVQHVMALRADGGVPHEIVTFQQAISGTRIGKVLAPKPHELVYLKGEFPLGFEDGGDFVLDRNSDCIDSYGNMEEIIHQILEAQEATPLEGEILQEIEDDTIGAKEEREEVEVLSFLAKFQDFNKLANYTSAKGSADEEALRLFNICVSFKSMTQTKQRGLAKCMPLGTYKIPELINIVRNNLVQGALVPRGVDAHEAAQVLMFLRQAQLNIDFNTGEVERKK